MMRAVGVTLIALLLLVGAKPAGPSLQAIRVSGAIPADPSWTGWKQARAVTRPLAGQTMTKPSHPTPAVGKITIRALHNGTEIAFLLEWKDPSKNTLVREGGFSDACAVEVPFKPDSSVPHFMGGDGKPVLLLHWKGIWEEGVVDLPRLYPNAAIDWYPPAKEDGPTAERGSREVAGSRWGHDRRTMPGHAAGNPMSVPSRPSRAEELVAEGFGNLATTPTQNTMARGIWADGRWKVVIIRPFKGKGGRNPEWGPGKRTFVNVAVWDGEQQERGPRKGILDEWLPLAIQ